MFQLKKHGQIYIVYLQSLIYEPNLIGWKKNLQSNVQKMALI